MTLVASHCLADRGITETLEVKFQLLLIVVTCYNVAGFGVHEMDPLAREAGDRFIGRFIGVHFLGGPTLHVLACIRAAIKECRHRSTTSRFKFPRFALCQRA
jgi:hypothetical protein